MFSKNSKNENINLSSMNLPDFNLPVLSGKSGTFSNKDIESVMLFSFVSDYCGPCQKELELIKSMCEKYSKEKIHPYIFAVGSGDKIKKSIDSLGLSCYLVKTDSIFLGKMKIQSIPTRILLENGKEITRIVGIPSYEEPIFVQKLEELIGYVSLDTVQKDINKKNL